MNNAVFSAVPEDCFREVLENLNMFTALPVRLIDGGGNVLLRFGEVMCDMPECTALLVKAGETAFSIGEAYIFTCLCGLNLIAFPLADDGGQLATVITGPFLLGSGEGGNTDTAPVMEPARVNNLKIIIEYLLSNLIPGEKALIERKRQQLLQQSRINESIQAYKQEQASSDLKFRYEKEKELLGVVKTGDVKNAKRVLNELLGNAIFCGGGLSAVRYRAVELTTLLSRVAMDGGAKPENIYDMSSKYISMLQTETHTEELCMILQDVVENFMSATFYNRDGGNPYIRRSLRYISENYRRHIDLETVAAAVGISESYFSMLFNSVMGMSFKDYLNALRVEEGKRLLLSTDYALADIAISLGFPDQSYFSKVFKKITASTPGSFRKKSR